MPRHSSLLPIALLLFVLLFSVTAFAVRPNFVVIVCDDLGYGDLACYGNKVIKTPHLDRLASEGIRFTDCYSTAPVCSSSRAGLLTGRTPSRLGVYDWIPANHPMHLPRSEITIAQLLQGADYDTCQVGKWHCNGKFNSPDQPQPDDMGFDYWCATQNNASPTHHNPTNFVRNGLPVGELTGYSCQLVADEAIRWLRNRADKSRPFFQFVCFHEPHEPIDSPPELVAQYPQATKRGEALYYANVANMDAAVGRLSAALEELELTNDTLVFFTSDNGPETLNRYRGAWRSHGSPGQLRGMKLHLYEAGIRVNGILRFPAQVRAGQVINTAVCALDLLPTFCEMAAVEAPADRVLDGDSIAALLFGQPFQREKPLYWHYFNSIGRPKAALRDGDWMILGSWNATNTHPGGSLRAGDMQIIKSAQLVDFELYNLRRDLSQQHDLAGTEPKRLARLRAQLAAKYTEVQKKGPVWDVEKNR